MSNSRTATAQDNITENYGSLSITFHKEMFSQLFTLKCGSGIQSHGCLTILTLK
jgi:hypothetical protein